MTPEHLRMFELFQQHVSAVSFQGRGRRALLLCVCGAERRSFHDAREGALGINQDEAAGC